MSDQAEIERELRRLHKELHELYGENPLDQALIDRYWIKIDPLEEELKNG